MLGFPVNYTNVQRSGTWMTIRHAEKVGRPTMIIYPDGNVERFEWEELP